MSYLIGLFSLICSFSTFLILRPSSFDPLSVVYFHTFPLIPSSSAIFLLMGGASRFELNYFLICLNIIFLLSPIRMNSPTPLLKHLASSGIKVLIHILMISII